MMEILQTLEAGIAAEDASKVEPLPCDKWLASSAWQKSVRRGHVETAQRAAKNFWEQDRKGFWRRCLLAAVEDCGIGSSDVTAKVLSAYAASSWRKELGDLRVALHLTRLLCGATKSRLADQTFIIAERAPEYAELRTRLAAAGDTVLAGYAANDGAPLMERLLALWYLAGTHRFPSDQMPPRVGYIEKAIEVLKELEAPITLTTACLSVLTKTQYPLALFTPMLAHVLQKMPQPLHVWFDPLPALNETQGIPHYAADTFTRLGKACIRQLQQAAPVFKQFSTVQIGLAVFYAEGGKVDKELTGADLEEFKQAGEVADIESSGLCLPRYLGLKELLALHWQTFEEIRHKELCRYADDQQQFQGKLI